MEDEEKEAMSNKDNMKLVKAIRRYGYGKWAVLIFCFVFPYISIRVTDQHEWLGRLVGLAVAFGFGIPFFIWKSVSPKTKMISKKAKLNQPRFKKTKHRVALLFRAFFLLIGIGLLWGMLIPLAIDISSIACGNSLVTVKGSISTCHSPLGLTIISQNITLDELGHKNSYYFWYSFRSRLHCNSCYEFLILPRSKFILEAKEIKNSTGNGLELP